MADADAGQIETLCHALLEGAPDAMVVADESGRIIVVNAQAERLFGFPREELVGQPVELLIPARLREGHRQERDRFNDRPRMRMMGSGVELKGVRKDGLEFPVEVSLSPVRSSQGLLVTAAIRDITIRKAAEHHLRQLELRYRGLLQAAPDAMILVNDRGEIVLVNAQAAKQFGYENHELATLRVRDVMVEPHAESLIVDCAQQQPGAHLQIAVGVELTGRRRDGAEFPIDVTAGPLESPDGVLVTVAIRDITERRRAETNLLHALDELNRSNEELGHFAYIASHDLQEPLRMVTSYTQLLAKRYKGKLDADADEFIGFAVDGAMRMQRLIHDLLTYSRVGTTGRDPAEISSQQALSLALTNLQTAIAEAGATITHGELPMVTADERQLVQLFQNLLGNAIKYRSAAPPSVHVSALRGPRSRWVFSVADNGIGIDARHFTRIFGMFQRLHTREEFAGTGIGLAICKKIVERHGGSISVDSRVGVGSTFRFDLAAGGSPT